MKLVFFHKKFSFRVLKPFLTIILALTFLIDPLLTNLALATSTTNTWTYNTANAGQFTYDSSLVTVDNSGARPITGVNKITNPSFETDTSSWSYAADSALTTSGGLITDATRTTNTDGDGLTTPAGYGIWPAATNLVDNGGFESNTTGWTFNSSNNTRTTDQQKFGAYSVYWQPLAQHAGMYRVFTATASQTYTLSGWFRRDSATIGTPTLYLMNNSNSAIKASTVLADTTAWQYVTATGVAGVGETQMKWQLQDSGADFGVNGKIYVDGAQAETGSVATPYIETNGATASRTAGRVQAPVSNLLTTTQGWVAARVRYGYASTALPSSNPYLFDWRDNSNNLLGLYFDVSTKKWTTIRNNGGSSNTAITAAQTFSNGDAATVIAAYTGSQIKVSVNGGAFVATSDTNIPTLAATLFDIGSQAGSSQLDGNTFWYAAGSGTLSDSDASTINGFGSTPPATASFPTGSTVTGLWPAVTSSWTSGSLVRSTTTTYLSSAGSAKLFAASAADLTQSVNVGDTNNYTLETYAYTDGSAVSASDLSLFYNGSTISTTYTSVGSGWYKLSGTLTGANAARNYGVQVAAGKTVYTDDYTLYKTGTYSVYNTTAYSNSDLLAWSSFAASATATGNSSVNYQICTDDGSSCSYSSGSRWQYYTGGAWTNATDATSAYTNTVAQLTNAAMAALSTSSKKISVKAILGFGGSDTPALSSVTIGLTTNVAPTIGSLGPTAKVDGSWTNSNQPQLTFTTADTDSGDTVKYQIQIDTHSNFSAPVVDYTSALATPGSSSFTVGQATGGGTYTTGSSGQTLSDNSYYWRVKAIDNNGLASAYSTANSGAIAFKLDTVNPTTPGSPSTTTPTNSNTQTWVWTAATDVLSGIANYAWRVVDPSNNPIVSGTTSALSVITNLANGAYTFFVKAIDNAGNNGSESSGSVIVDTVGPAGINLSSPGDQAYTNNNYPTFSWQTTTAAAGISKYILSITNPSLGSGQPSGNFTIDNIPTSGTTSIQNSQYTVSFSGFNDSDPNNNYISVQAQPSSNWGSSSNNGALREGVVSWQVTAVDNAGNQTSASRTVFEDNTHPNMDITQINSTSIPSSTTSFTTNNPTSTIFGSITDPLGGNSAGQQQGNNGPLVASGPKSIQVQLEQQGFLGTYTLNTLATVNITQMFRSDNGNIITNNSQNPASKFSGFSYTLPAGLQNGTYRLTFTPQDNSGNTGSPVVFSLTIGYGSSNITQQIKPRPGPNSNLSPTNPSASPTPTPEKIVTLQKEQQPKGPNFFIRMVGGVLIFGSNVVHYVADVGSSGFNSIAQGLKKPTQLANHIGTWIAYSAATFPEMVIDNQPTKISDVQISQISKTTAVISWKTNHHTFNNKVNYGQDLSYGHDAFAPDYTKEHSVEIANLQPGVKYVFEVMSQNKNYVYDAAHEFTTSK